MGPFSNDPGLSGAPQATPSSWTGQPGTSQGAPTWLSQSAALPPGVQPTLLDRSSPWPALRLIARWLKIISWIELGFGVITALVVGSSIGTLGMAMSTAGGNGAGSGTGFVGFIFAVYLLIVTVIGFILTYATAELILVFLAIEKNTRKNE